MTRPFHAEASRDVDALVPLQVPAPAPALARLADLLRLENAAAPFGAAHLERHGVVLKRTSLRVAIRLRLRRARRCRGATRWLGTSARHSSRKIVATACRAALPAPRVPRRGRPDSKPACSWSESVCWLSRAEPRCGPRRRRPSRGPCGTRAASTCARRRARDPGRVTATSAPSSAPGATEGAVGSRGVAAPACSAASTAASSSVTKRDSPPPETPASPFSDVFAFPGVRSTNAGTTLFAASEPHASLSLSNAHDSSSSASFPNSSGAASFSARVCRPRGRTRRGARARRVHRRGARLGGRHPVRRRRRPRRTRRRGRTRARSAPARPR